MKFLAPLLLLSSFAAFGSFPEINVEELNGTYLDAKGRAHAMKAQYVLPKVEIKHENIDVVFDKVERKLRISDPSTSVTLDFDFSFLNIFKSFEFTGVEIKSIDKLFWVQSDVLNLFINDTSYNLDDFYVETDVRNIPTQDDEDISIVDGLILNAVFNTKTLRFSNVDKEKFLEDLRLENNDRIEEISNLSSDKNIPVVVRNISYVVKDGVFHGKALMDSWINLWLRLNGKMSTNKENSELTIRIDRAKLGFFSIRGTLLKRVRALNLEGVQVIGNEIKVKLDTVILGNRRRDQ
ncbi:MAG: hypothetical protein VYA54_05485 [Bdellovibrionota bacterium]|nr:hypothetical protein [Bdellovibrionota bacterium]